MPGFAIVGCGMIAGFHLKALAEIDGARVVAVVDSVPAALERFAAKRGPLVLSPSAKQSVIAKVRDTMASIPLDVYLASTHTTWTGDYRKLLPKIDVPTLVLWGEHDRDVAPRKLSEELAANIPTCDGVVVVPRAGHVCNLDNPEFFNAAIADFVTRYDKM